MTNVVWTSDGGGRTLATSRVAGLAPVLEEGNENPPSIAQAMRPWPCACLAWSARRSRTSIPATQATPWWRGSSGTPLGTAGLRI